MEKEGGRSTLLISSDPLGDLANRLPPEHALGTVTRIEHLEQAESMLSQRCFDICVVNGLPKKITRGALKRLRWLHGGQLILLAQNDEIPTFLYECFDSILPSQINAGASSLAKNIRALEHHLVQAQEVVRQLQCNLGADEDALLSGLDKTGNVLAEAFSLIRETQSRLQGFRKRRVPSTLPTKRQARILVIDDEELLARAYARALSPPHQVVTAVNGEEGLARLKTDQAFDVILCDFMMPGTDGLGVYEAIKAMAPHLVPKIIFSSGGAYTERATRFFDEVPNLVLEKPVSGATLRAAIEEFLEQSQEPSQIPLPREQLSFAGA